MSRRLQAVPDRRLPRPTLAKAAGNPDAATPASGSKRSGIFAALLDDDERAFQQQVLAGPPPLGPGAAPLDLWVPKTCATWADVLRNAVGLGQAPGVSRASLGQSGGGMIFGLWA
jgi:hypothetical protein